MFCQVIMTNLNSTSLQFNAESINCEKHDKTGWKNSLKAYATHFNELNSTWKSNTSTLSNAIQQQRCPIVELSNSSTCDLCISSLSLSQWKTLIIYTKTHFENGIIMQTKFCEYLHVPFSIIRLPIRRCALKKARMYDVNDNPRKDLWSYPLVGCRSCFTHACLTHTLNIFN